MDGEVPCDRCNALFAPPDEAAKTKVSDGIPLMCTRCWNEWIHLLSKRGKNGVKLKISINEFAAEMHHKSW